jgi:hypothetical protein
MFKEPLMRAFAIVLVMTVCVSATASAQTEGKISVGASVTQVIPTDSEVGSFTGFGPVVRLNPKRGWGVAAALNWFRADIDDPGGFTGDFVRIRIRPLMGGVSYSVGPDKLLTSFSIVAGPSFNSARFRDEFLNALQPGPVTPDIDIETSFVVRPGVSVTWTLAPRVAIVGFGGYMWNRPGIVYRNQFGVEFRDEWKADAIVLSVGAVYSLF